MIVINFLGNRIGSGGIESFVTNMSEGMSEFGIEYRVCVNYRTSNIYEKQLIQNGADVIYLREIPTNYIGRLIDFIKYISKNKNAILYLHASTPGMYLHASIAKMIGINRIVYHVHSTPSNRTALRSKLKDDYLQAMFSDIPLVNVACSKKAGDAFYKKEEYSVVHNGINVERFRYSSSIRESMRKELGLNNEFMLLQVGRLSPQKNQFFTLELFMECYKNDWNVKLIFIGEGQSKSDMEKYIEEKNIEDYVSIVTPDFNVEKYYMAADLLLFPSEFEGLGIVALESQVAGLPVLASSCIVDEVCFTDFIQRINLDSKNLWLSKINHYIDADIDRETMSKIGYTECLKNGYSIEYSRKELVNIYRYVDK